MGDYFNNLSQSLTTICVEKNITDYKTCIEYHKIKENKYLYDPIKKRYDVINKFEPLIKKCIENKINKVECYFNQSFYTYSSEFYKMYDDYISKNKK